AGGDLEGLKGKDAGEVDEDDGDEQRLVILAKRRLFFGFLSGHSAPDCTKGFEASIHGTARAAVQNASSGVFVTMAQATRSRRSRAPRASLQSKSRGAIQTTSGSRSP